MTLKNKASQDYLGQKFIITREFDAPRELVFQAWTDPKHLVKWWGPRGFTNPVCEWDARPGKTIHVVMRAPNGMEFPMGGEFREVVAPKRLVFASGALDAEGKLLFEFLHTVTFTERSGKTKLTIKSEVIKTTAGAGRYISGFEAGMTQSLVRLAELLAAAPLPLVVERTFNAAPAVVWRAITSLDALKQWFFDLKKFKPEAGFKFQFDVEHKGAEYFHRCQVKEVIPGKKLAYSWRYEGHEGNSLVTFELTPLGKKTKLKLTHEGLETFPQTPVFARKNFMGGWTELIGNSLKKFVETTKK